MRSSGAKYFVRRNKQGSKTNTSVALAIVAILLVVVVEEIADSTSSPNTCRSSWHSSTIAVASAVLRTPLCQQ